MLCSCKASVRSKGAARSYKSNNISHNFRAFVDLLESRALTSHDFTVSTLNHGAKKSVY